MPLLRPTWVVMVLLTVPALAGCLGDEAELPPGPNGTPSVDAPETGPLRLVTPNETVQIDKWLGGAARDLPSVTRLGQLDHWETPQGAMRLLTDGQAFVLVVDQSVARYEEGTFVFMRIYTDDGTNVAGGLWSARGNEGAHVPVAVVPNDIIRFGVAYRYEVVVFVPDDRPDCRCSFSSNPNDDGLEVGGMDHYVIARIPGTTPRVTTNAWNGTIVDHRDEPLSFRPTWDLAFEGPAEGSDRPDPLERQLVGGPETGVYTFTFTGERVWLSDVLFDFSRSRIAATDPEVGNGSSTLQIQLDGWQPLESYLAMAPSKGIQQAFTLRLRIDYETQDDLPAEEEQFFFVTTSVGYRQGGSTYVADTDGREQVVRVQNTV